MKFKFKPTRFVIAFAIAASVVLIAEKAMANGVNAAAASNNNGRAPQATSPVASSSAPTTPSSAPVNGYITPSWAQYYRDIDALRADSTRAQEELANLKIHHELDEARKGNFSDSNSSGQTNTIAPLPANSFSSTSPSNVGDESSRSPEVEQVTMVDGHWAATIRLSSGARLVVHQDQNVAGLGKVSDISLDEVLVVKGSKIISLPFAANDTLQSSAASGSSFPIPTSSFPTLTAPPLGMH